MFSPRCLAILALIATAVALPASDRQGLQLNKRIMNTVDSAWSNPRIITDDGDFQVIFQVKDVTKNDLKVVVKGDFIIVQSTREANDNRNVFASQLFQRYTLPVNSSAADVTAELTSDGYLVLNIIFGKDISKETDREVAIVETGAPLNKEAGGSK